MDSPHFETPALTDRLRHAIWHGDWDDAQRLAGTPLHGVTLDELREMLAAARSGRSAMLGSLGRLRAAAGFNNLTGQRQLFAGPTEF